VQIVKSPGFAGRVEPLGFEARATTRDEFAQFNADEIKRWGDIVRSAFNSISDAHASVK
jgi:tripartite-type tricarboxylate transporter receptor subunit TctC